MAKLTENYEAIVVFSAKLAEEDVKGLVEKFGGMIEANAENVSVDEWGKRKLAGR